LSIILRLIDEFMGISEIPENSNPSKSNHYNQQKYSKETLPTTTNYYNQQKYSKETLPTTTNNYK